MKLLKKQKKMKKQNKNKNTVMDATNSCRLIHASNQPVGLDTQNQNCVL